MLMVVPPMEEEPWPTLGPGVCELIEDRCIYGPGSLAGQPYVIDPEFRSFIYRAFEIYPKGHEWEGRRRFKRVGLSVRKGLAKTEKMAILAFVELHPEGPTRFDGWDAYGNPVGRPVRSPYIPMLAVSVDQVEELAFGALKYMVDEGPDADLFDSGLERIIRLGPGGREDGKAVPLSNSPGSRDGARTTLNCFDEPHRLFLPRQLKAHETMAANLPKRPLDDPWSLYVGTAGALGENSIAEQLHEEAELIERGEIKRPDLFYLYRTDDGGHDLSVKEERITAITEATGPAGEWGPGQFDQIASQWDRPGADRSFLERVWLNRWRASEATAFDIAKWSDESRVRPRIPAGSFVVAGFDGARFRDSTAIVVTDVETGVQDLWGLWERPEDDDRWEINEADVTSSVRDMFSTFQVDRMLCDPPHWYETVAAWSALYPNRVLEFHTQNRRQMADAIRMFVAGLDSGALLHTGNPDLTRHVRNAGRKDTEMYDDDGNKLFLLQKQKPELKFDAAMAAVLSWRARLDAIRSGAKPRRKSGFVGRVR